MLFAMMIALHEQPRRGRLLLWPVSRAARTFGWTSNPVSSGGSHHRNANRPDAVARHYRKGDRPQRLMGDSPLVAFYRGDGRDHRGRSLSDIQELDFYELEFNHDYIQWLFPLPEPSGANASAPLLSNDDIARFQSDESLRKRLLQSFELMLSFFGLEWPIRCRGRDQRQGSRAFPTAKGVAALR